MTNSRRPIVLILDGKSEHAHAKENRIFGEKNIDCSNQLPLISNIRDCLLRTHLFQYHKRADIFIKSF